MMTTTFENPTFGAKDPWRTRREILTLFHEKFAGDNNSKMRPEGVELILKKMAELETNDFSTMKSSWNEQDNLKSSIEVKEEKIKRCKIKPKLDNNSRSSSKGVGDLWCGANHVALVVADVGRSLQFYTDILGMKQTLRPDFDRHGAWLTFGNLDLHLIKGLPAVHSDDNLVVCHLAISVSDMGELRRRLNLMGIKARKSVNVPKKGKEGDPVDQALIRDPDGYYIEFCGCEELEEYLHSLELRGAEAKISDRLALKLRSKAAAAREFVRVRRLLHMSCGQGNVSKFPTVPADPIKLANLVARRKVYADITQSSTEKEIKELLSQFNNDVPMVILFLEEKKRKRGALSVIPSAFYDRDGKFVQPPTFEIPDVV